MCMLWLQNSSSRLLHYTACTHVHCSTHSTTVQSAAQPKNGLPKSTTCPSSNYTHCSQLLPIHRMVAYSNPSPVENKMAARTMLIRDTFMLPAELTAITYMEQGNTSCACGPRFEWPNSARLKSMKMSDIYVAPPLSINITSSTTTQYRHYQLHHFTAVTKL